MARGKRHRIGFMRGTIIERDGGDIEYMPSGKFLPAFRVNIADITGFSVRKPTKEDRKIGASKMEQVLVLQGGGTELAACPVAYGTAEKIEAWIRKHPLFRGNVPQNAPPTPEGSPPASIADELAKLVQLRDGGVLSSEEFEQAKGKLLR